MRKFVNLAVLALLAATITSDVVLRATSSNIVISEFRVRGPQGGNDEFIELYNKSAAPVAIGGWKINGSNNTAGSEPRPARGPTAANLPSL